MKKGTYLGRLATVALSTLLASSFVQSAHAQTFGLLEDDGHSKGLTLFAPIRGTSAYLIDGKGRLVKRWQDPDGYSAGASMYLSNRGTLVRALAKNESGNAGAGSGGLIREYDWDGNVIWNFDYDTTSYWTHHDIELMPNGNVMITAFEYVLLDENNSCRDKYGNLNRVDAETEGATRFDHLIEVRPNYDTGEGGDIEWEWHLCDHLGDSDPAKWDHLTTDADGNEVERAQSYNAIDYHHERDQILMGCNVCNELYIIDHSHSSKKTRGPKGDFIYRWGNPENYGAGTSTDRRLGGQHTVRFIKQEFGLKLNHREKLNNVDNIIAFNNQHQVNGPCANPGFACSAVIEITPPYDAATNSYDMPAPGLAYGPSDFAAVVQNIVDDSGNRNFLSFFLSSGQKIPHGRYLIDVGAGNPVTEFFETSDTGDVSWKYVSPAATLNPGGTPGPGKADDICMTAAATALPAGGTQWPFRATRYDRGFRGFKHKDLSGGPLLTDVVNQVAGEEYGDCPTR